MGRRRCGNAVLGDPCHWWVRAYEPIPAHAILFDIPSAATSPFCICCFDICSWFGASDARGWTWARRATVYALPNTEFDGGKFADPKHDGWPIEAA